MKLHRIFGSIDGMLAINEPVCIERAQQPDHSRTMQLNWRVIFFILDYLHRVFFSMFIDEMQANNANRHFVDNLPVLVSSILLYFHHMISEPNSNYFAYNHRLLFDFFFFFFFFRPSPLSFPSLSATVCLSIRLFHEVDTVPHIEFLLSTHSIDIPSQ